MNALWMLVASVLFSVMGACVKLAGRHYGVTEILFYRSLIGAACLFTFVHFRGMSLSTPLAGLHLRRGVVGTAAVFLWFYATTVLPLGTALTLNYTSPLFLALLVMGVAMRSGRRIDWPLMATVGIGFVGVILVLQPNFAPGQAIGAAGGLFSGVLSAIAYWQVKELGERGEPEWRVVFYFSLTGTILGGLGSLAIGFTDAHAGRRSAAAGDRHRDVAGATRNDARLRSGPHRDRGEPAVLRDRVRVRPRSHAVRRRDPADRLGRHRGHHRERHRLDCADRAPASAAHHFHRVSRQELNMPYTTLVTVEQLQEHLEDPAWRVIDVRHDLMDVEVGPRAYKAGHIPAPCSPTPMTTCRGRKTGRNGRHPSRTAPISCGRSGAGA